MFDLDLTLEPMDLTLDELSDLESMAGVPVTQLLEDLRTQSYTAAEMKAVVFVIARRTQPDLKAEDVGALKLSDINVIYK